MNVNRCAGFKAHGQYCAFLDLTLDDKGKVDEHVASCRLRGRPIDDYRIYPEHDSETGVVIRNQAPGSSDPIPTGPNVIWETLTPASNGLTYDALRGIRSEDYNSHPLYTIGDTNEPSATEVSDNAIITPFGEGENLAFSTTGWRGQQIRGLERVDKCLHGIYGSYSAQDGMVMPKCVKDYCNDIPDWVNYTTIPASKKRQYTFFVAKASNQDIVNHVIKWFGETPKALAIAEILIAVRSGEFINMWNVLENHMVNDEDRRAFMSETNTWAKNIHKPVNLFKYYLYYGMLKRDLPYAKGLVLRANLINYLLNDPNIASIDPDEPDNVLKGNVEIFKPSRRYWWLVQIIVDAYKEGIQPGKRAILNLDILPNWLNTMIEATRKKEDKVPNDFRHPGIVKLMDIVKDIDAGEYAIKDTQHWHRRARVFAHLAKAGQRWTLPALKSTWYNFCKAYDAGIPERFWAWLDAVRKATPDQLQELLIEPFDIPPRREFAMHLLASSLSIHNFKVTQTPLVERWALISPRGMGKTSEAGEVKGEPSDVFWQELKRLNVKTGKAGKALYERFKAHFITMDPEHAKALIHDYTAEAAEDVILGTHIDGDDIGRQGPARIIDYSGAEELYHKEGEDSDVSADSHEDEEA